MIGAIDAEGSGSGVTGDRDYPTDDKRKLFNKRKQFDEEQARIKANLDLSIQREKIKAAQYGSVLEYAQAVLRDLTGRKAFSVGICVCLTEMEVIGDEGTGGDWLFDSAWDVAFPLSILLGPCADERKRLKGFFDVIKGEKAYLEQVGVHETDGQIVYEIPKALWEKMKDAAHGDEDILKSLFNRVDDMALKGEEPDKGWMYEDEWREVFPADGHSRPEQEVKERFRSLWKSMEGKIEYAECREQINRYEAELASKLAAAEARLFEVPECLWEKMKKAISFDRLIDALLVSVGEKWYCLYSARD